MNNKMLNRRKLCLVLLSLLTLITSINAQPFGYKGGDLCLGFRKTGSYQGLYEIVVDIGPATNFVNLPAGTTTNIVRYTASQIDPDAYGNLTNLSWSVVGYTPSATTFSGYAKYTLWATVPRVGGVSAPAANRSYQNAQQQAASPIKSIFDGAVSISSGLASNKDNTATCVLELISAANNQNYGGFMGDPSTSSYADLGGEGPLDVNGAVINLEETTVAPFTTAVKSDLYQLVPTSYNDPQSQTTTGPGYNVGYFQLNTDGTMSFTRASATAPAPVAAFSGTPTNGFAPLLVTFTDASTGTITNWLWNLGDGTAVTNTSNTSVNHTYSVSGNYTVSLTVTGPGGANTVTQSSYVVTAATPKFSSSSLVSGQFVLSGANCPAGVQYRILCSTNLAVGNWKPVATNYFLSNGTFSYTNPTTNAVGYFRLVSP